MNRVNQIYETESAIRMVLIADTDKLNLNTAALATGANGPCGAAACYTAGHELGCGGGMLDRNRIVAGQIVGASAYDIGHIAMGNSGGGVAGLGVVGLELEGRAAAPAWPRRSATTSPSTTWRTRWATSSPATTRSTARSSTAAATAAARPRSSRARARR